MPDWRWSQRYISYFALGVAHACVFFGSKRAFIRVCFLCNNIENYTIIINNSNWSKSNYFSIAMLMYYIYFMFRFFVNQCVFIYHLFTVSPDWRPIFLIGKWKYSHQAHPANPEENNGKSSHPILGRNEFCMNKVVNSRHDGITSKAWRLKTTHEKNDKYILSLALEK